MSFFFCIFFLLGQNFAHQNHNHHNHQSSDDYEGENLKPHERPGIVLDGISVDFENKNIEPWTIMKGMVGRASLEIGGDRNNHYAALATHGLHDRIENNNPDSPQDFTKLTSGETEVRNTWYRRYCLQFNVLPLKSTTQFNVTAVWMDANGDVQAEFKILRIYTKDDGETRGTCHGKGAQHENAVCIPMRDGNGQKVWTPVSKMKMFPKSNYVSLELKSYKDSDFAFDNIQFTDCSLDPDVDEKPKWVTEQEGHQKQQFVYGKAKYGTYYTGLSWEAEEKLWKEKRAQMKAQAELTAGATTTTQATITTTRPRYFATTRRPNVWTTYPTTTRTTQRPHISSMSNDIYTVQTSRPSTRQTAPAKPTDSRPTLPSDWGNANNKDFVPFVLDAETTSIPFNVETTEQEATTTQSLLDKIRKTKSKKLTKNKKSASCKISIFISLLLIVLLL